MKTKIDDCKKYWDEFLEPDYQEYFAQQGDLRRAFHCAISLFHMADWIYKEKGLAYWQAVGLDFVNRNGVREPVRDEKTFANALAAIDQNFELIRNIANSAKHFSLSRPGSHPSSPSHAANTYSQSSTFHPAMFDADVFDTTDKVLLEGPSGRDLLFLDLANSVRTTLHEFCTEHLIRI